MFKIGDFSKLSQVTIKALRLYDELNLLKPARIDPESGYRYYSAEQISRLNQILVLKNLGFTLEQAAVMLNGGIRTDQFREMLLARRKQLEENVRFEQERLLLVEARLRQIENEGGELMSQNEVVIKSVEPIRVYSLRDVIPTFSAVGGLFHRLYEDITAAGAKMAGPGIQIYHESEYKDHDIDVEAAFPVTGGSKLALHELPGIAKAACLIHNGSYEMLHASYALIGKWIEDNGYSICGNSREVYLKTDDQASDQSEYVTEIQIPVEKL